MSGFSARRRLLALIASSLAAPAVVAQPGTHARKSASDPPATVPPRITSHESRVTPYAPVVPGYRLRFPFDEGSHPAFRTEWWYVTGWLDPTSRAPMGFQVTFFRVQPDIDARHPSAFAPRQLVIAHAALSEPRRGRLIHDQKVARAVFGLAGADEERTKVWTDEWSLSQEDAEYRVRIPAREFSFDFTLTTLQPPLLQGDNGYSRKGPRPDSASYYYSIPHLKVEGALVESGRRAQVSGQAWLDHEWSSTYMDERAAGWDWIGINLDDGGAVMAFRMRDKAGAKFWAGGAYREADGTRRTFNPAEVEFTPLRVWRSPRTGSTYPVAWRVRVGNVELTIEPLMNDQEHDTRLSAGTIYWEGAVRASRHGVPVGRGYLELTGYWQPLKL